LIISAGKAKRPSDGMRLGSLFEYQAGELAE
jgi:hypothetical protein